MKPSWFLDDEVILQRIADAKAMHGGRRSQAERDASLTPLQQLSWELEVPESTINSVRRRIVEAGGVEEFLAARSAGRRSAAVSNLRRFPEPMVANFNDSSWMIPNNVGPFYDLGVHTPIGEADRIKVEPLTLGGGVIWARHVDHEASSWREPIDELAAALENVYVGEKDLRWAQRRYHELGGRLIERFSSTSELYEAFFERVANPIPPNRGPGRPKGSKHTDLARERISAAMKERWRRKKEGDAAA